MKKSILLFVTVLVLFNSKITAQQLSQSSWNDYTGTIGSTEPWGGWVRGYGQDNTGSYILDSGNVVGQIDTNLIDSLYTSMLVLPATYDLMLQTKGLGSAKDTPRVNLYLNRIEADSGAIWRELCKLEAKKLAGLPNGKNRIIWQVGNEISSHSYSQQLRLWAGSTVPCGGNGCAYDDFIIPIYAEYYLAPSVQGINEASQQLFGSPDSIAIALGSITNAGGSGASVWLDSLLNYTIIGTYAPALAGKKIYELVDIISLHYIMGKLPSNSWKTVMDNYKNTWIGTGKIKGIWSTEEVGIQAANAGMGAVIGSIATSRYLEWAITNNFSPFQCRTNYYAYKQGPVNTQVNDVNQEIFNFLDTAYVSLIDSAKLSYDNATVESHAFLSADSSKGIIYSFMELALPAYGVGGISKIKIVNSAMGNITGATCHRYSASGHQIITPTITTINDTTELNFGSVLPLDSVNSVIVTLLQTNPTVTAINDLSLSEWSIHLFPNPTSGIVHLNINSHNIKNIKLFNLQGQLIQEYFTNNFSVSNLVEGIYFITIETDKSIFTNKLIKQP